MLKICKVRGFLAALFTILTLSFSVLFMSGAFGYFAHAVSTPSASSSKVSTASVPKAGVDGHQDAGPPDIFDRGTPRSCVEGFLSYAAKGDFKNAAQYLDLRYLPRKVKGIPPEELARKLKIVLDRALWLDLSSISMSPEGARNDNLPSYQERIGRIKTPEGQVDIILQRVPRKDGVRIWKFSNRTVASIPLLYKYYGYRLFEEKLSSIFPDMQFAGWQLWQWCMWLILLAAAWVAVWFPTWLAALVIRRRDGGMSGMMGNFLTGPLRLVLWLFLGRMAVSFLIPSVEIRRLLDAGTFFILGLCWAGIKALDILFEVWKQRIRRDGRESSTVLLKPLRTVLRVSIATVALLQWLNNIGFNVSALLAGLGVGGLAVALAAQGVLKNLIGTVMILADRPYNVGERIVVNGYDGEVEEIGLRSTKLRLLTGHQTSIPNAVIERAEIENIGRRPHIRRKQDIRLAIDTPPDKVERAVEIIRDILDNHEGMRKEYPPRIYFDRFRSDGLNIVMFYWYHPADYWAYLDFSQRTNSAILKAFEAEGISLALPASKSVIAGAEDDPPLKITSESITEMEDRVKSNT